MSKSSEAVRELLKRSGMTKAALCAAAGVSRSSLDEYLKGTREPSVRQLERLGAAAGHQVDIVWHSASKTPAWVLPDDPGMKPRPLTVAERAQVLEVVVATAVQQQRRARGPLLATPFRRLRKRDGSSFPS
jgi:transcriptional regulator with XRE-family HTH domain